VNIWRYRSSNVAMFSSLLRVRACERRGRRLTFISMGFPGVGKGACSGSARRW